MDDKVKKGKSKPFTKYHSVAEPPQNTEQNTTFNIQNRPTTPNVWARQENQRRDASKNVMGQSGAGHRQNTRSDVKSGERSHQNTTSNIQNRSTTPNVWRQRKDTRNNVMGQSATNAGAHSDSGASARGQARGEKKSSMVPLVPLEAIGERKPSMVLLGASGKKKETLGKFSVAEREKGQSKRPTPSQFQNHYTQKEEMKKLFLDENGNRITPEKKKMFDNLKRRLENAHAHEWSDSDLKRVLQGLLAAYRNKVDIVKYIEDFRSSEAPLPEPSETERERTESLTELFQKYVEQCERWIKDFHPEVYVLDLQKEFVEYNKSISQGYIGSALIPLKKICEAIKDIRDPYPALKATLKIVDDVLHDYGREDIVNIQGRIKVENEMKIPDDLAALLQTKQDTIGKLQKDIKSLDAQTQKITRKFKIKIREISRRHNYPVDLIRRQIKQEVIEDAKERFKQVLIVLDDGVNDDNLESHREKLEDIERVHRKFDVLLVGHIIREMQDNVYDLTHTYLVTKKKPVIPFVSYTEGLLATGYKTRAEEEEEERDTAGPLATGYNENLSEEEEEESDTAGPLATGYNETLSKEEEEAREKKNVAEKRNKAEKRFQAIFNNNNWQDLRDMNTNVQLRRLYDTRSDEVHSVAGPNIRQLPSDMYLRTDLTALVKKFERWAHQHNVKTTTGELRGEYECKNSPE